MASVSIFLSYDSILLVSFYERTKAGTFSVASELYYCQSNHSLEETIRIEESQETFRSSLNSFMYNLCVCWTRAFESKVKIRQAALHPVSYHHTTTTLLI